MSGQEYFEYLNIKEKSNSIYIGKKNTNYAYALCLNIKEENALQHSPLMIIIFISSLINLILILAHRQVQIQTKFL